MNWCVVLARGMLVARRTDFVALVFQASRVWIVTVRTSNVLMVHLALNKRAMYIHLIENLTVGVIGVFQQKLIRKVVIEFIAGTKIRFDDAPPRVTLKAGVELCLRRLLVLLLRQAVAVVAIPEQSLRTGDLDMQARRPVACLATDINLRVGRVVGSGLGVEAFL